MRFCISLVIATVSFLFPIATAAQSDDLAPDRLLARISYQSTYTVEHGEQHYFPRICFALYRSGHYRISKLTANGAKIRQGNLTDAEFSQLSGMLQNLRSERSGGLVLQGSESFLAEIVRGDETVRYVWMDPDHQQPFPEDAANLVKWLQNFRASGSFPFTLHELDDEPVCPPAFEEPVQPVTADKEFGCGARSK